MPRKRVATMECVIPIMTRAHEKLGQQRKAIRRHRKALNLLKAKQSTETETEQLHHEPFGQAEFTFTCLLDGLCSPASQLSLTEEQQSGRFLSFLRGSDTKDGEAPEPMEGVEMTPPELEPEVEDIDWLNSISTDVVSFEPRAPVPESLTEFPIFGQLPIELRLKIFEWALSPNHKGQRILTVTGIVPTAKSMKVTKMVSQSQAHHSTVLSAVCHESRDVHLRTYPHRVLLAGHSILRFNGRHTLFYLPNFELSSSQFFRFSMSEYWPWMGSWMREVRILAVDTFDQLLALATESPKWGKMPPFFHFANLRRVVLLVNRNQLVKKSYQVQLGVGKVLLAQDKIEESDSMKKWSAHQKVSFKVKVMLSVVRNIMVDSVKARGDVPLGADVVCKRGVPEVVMEDLMMHDARPGSALGENIF